MWGVISKLLDAGIKFLTIPLLLGYFGKGNYSILTLAMATNAYMALLDMGMNTGSVKYFSQWIATEKYDLLYRTAQTNIMFYLGIGFINSSILIVLGIWGANVFQITPEEFEIFQQLLYFLAVFSIVNWITFVFNQLLIADEKVAFIQQIAVVRSVLGLAIVGITILYKWSLIQYFIVYLSLNAFVIFPYYFQCKKNRLIGSVFPALYWKDFAVVFKYGLAILAMSIFQFTATQSRPLILGIFSKDGIDILAEYRVIEVFPIFIISVGGMLIGILLPKTSKAIQNNDRSLIEKMAYEGTKYTSILVSVLCFPLMLSSQELLTLYVGIEYTHLSVWLMLWIFTLTLFLHNTPVASLVLATGKTKMLVLSSAVACIISIIINAVLCEYFGVGSAVIGYLVYIIILVSFYYFYFNSKVLNLKSNLVFKAFFIPTLIGFCIMLCILYLQLSFSSLFIQLVIKSLLWCATYFVILYSFKIIDFKEMIGKVLT